jgi:uncharacterized protein involved in cysteine biosynthesis
MVPTSPLNFLELLHAGIMAPLESLRFFKRHKFLLVSALAPHILFFVGGLWGALHFLLPFAEKYAAGLMEYVPGWILGSLFGVALFLLYTVLFALVFVQVINAILSPLYDHIAAKAFEDRAGHDIPQLGPTDFLRSFISEVSKTVLICTVVLLGFLLPTILPGGIFFTLIVAPFGILFSIWFYGWDQIDRTLALLGLPLKKRLVFGLRHFPLCLALGIWIFVPLIGSILSFTLSAAGAILVAQTVPSLGSGNLKGKT